MAKNTFINKKFLIICLFLIFAIAGGVGLYFLLKPKADLKAPYNNTMQLIINEDYNYVTEYNQTIIDYFNNYLDLTNNEYKLNEQKYESLNNILKIYNSINNQLIENFIFTKDYDNKMVQTQRSMTESYEKVLENVSICKNYINSYLTLDKIESYPTNQHIWQMIYNYNQLYFNFAKELSNFYFYAGEIFKNYLINTIDVNSLTKQNIQATVNWAKEIVANITGNDANVDQCVLSIENLKVFVTTNNNLKSDAYFFNKNYYDNILKCFNKINLSECINHLANNTFDKFASEQTSQEKIEFATKLGREYFLVLA